MPGQLHPTGVAHPAEHRPVVHRQVEQRRGQCGDQSAVRYQHHRPLGIVGAPLRLTGNQLGNQWRAAVGDVDAALPAVRRPPGVIAPRQPGTRGTGIHLMMGQALPVPEVSLPQPVVHSNRQAAALGQCLGGVIGAAKIGGNDDQRLPFGQHLGSGQGLASAQVGEVGVELTLHPASGIELRLAVAQHHQPPHPHVDSPACIGASRSTSTIGQSRHSRSSA